VGQSLFSQALAHAKCAAQEPTLQIAVGEIAPQT
jgi:hypothetical protein